MSVYIISGPFKGLRGTITSKRPVYKKPYLVKVYLSNHKAVIIDKKHISYREPRRVLSQVIPVETKASFVRVPVPPAPTGKCCYSLCNGCDESVKKCCCPSFVKCSVHDKYIYKHPKPQTTSKVGVLPIGSESIYRSTRFSMNRKSKRVTKSGITERQHEYEFEDVFQQTFDEFGESGESGDFDEELEVSTEEKYMRLTLELVDPINFDYSGPYKKSQMRRRGVRFIGGNIYLEEEFPIYPPSRKERHGIDQDTIRNIGVYEQIVAKRVV
jgi:hypothetical protein